MSDNLILPSYAAAPASSDTYDPSRGPQSLNAATASSHTAQGTGTPNPNASSSSIAQNGSGVQRPSIYEKNLNRRVPEVNLSTLSFLFCEMVNWAQQNSKGVQQLESRLNILGYNMGPKVLELSYLRENSTSGMKKTLKKDNKIIEILQFIYSVVWKNLFGKTADELEKSQSQSNEFMIIDNNPVISQFISVPKEFKHLNCCAFVAGIIEGLLDAAYFQASVTAHSVAKDGFPLRTVYLVKFDESVVQREMIRFG